MRRKPVVFALLSIFILLISGCATTSKNTDLEIQGLRNQVSVLETELQNKDEEINSLKESLAKVEQKKEASTEEAVKSKPRPKEIQIALRNAGYNPGKIDGRVGRQTKDAVRAFQRANKLPVTGKVNEDTWDLLKEYLHKKVK